MSWNWRTYGEVILVNSETPLLALNFVEWLPFTSCFTIEQTQCQYCSGCFWKKFNPFNFFRWKEEQSRERCLFDKLLFLSKIPTSKWIFLFICKRKHQKMKTFWLEYTALLLCPLWNIKYFPNVHFRLWMDLTNKLQSHEAAWFTDFLLFSWRSVVQPEKLGCTEIQEQATEVV